MQDICVRRAEKKDKKRISELIISEYKKSPYNEKWTEEDSMKVIEEYFKTDIIFVCKVHSLVEGVIIGKLCPYENGKYGFVDDFIVSKKFQGRGIGRNLHDAIEKYFKKRGAKKIELWSHKKSKAFSVYRKMGYREEKDFVCLTKKIDV